MDRVEMAAVAPLPEPTRTAPRMPQPALFFRWIVGLVGLIAVAALAPAFRTTETAALAVLLLVSIAAELLLSVELPRRRFVLLSGTFTFITFLSFGALGATLVSVSAILLSQLIRLLDRQPVNRPNVMFVVFNAGQIALSGLAAGAMTWLVTGTPFAAPPRAWTLPLIVYVLTYLATNTTLISIATLLRYSLREVREQLWPQVSSWTALSFAICGPLALMAEALATQVGILVAVLLTFAALISLSYILRLTLRYDRANAELKALNEIGASLAAALDFGTLFPSIYRGTSKLMDADAFYIALTDDERRAVNFSYLIRDGIEIAPRSFPYGTGLIAQVLKSGQPIVVDQVDATMSAGPTFGPSDRHSQSVMIVPLWAGERLIGAISTQSYSPRAYSGRELDLLVSIGRMAAIAIRNAQFFEREKTLLREREEFVSLVAHELKNPLAAIMGYHQIAARRLRAGDDGLRRPLQVIADQAQRLNRLVEDLLDLSRADAGRLALDRKPADLRTVIRDVVDQQQLQTQVHRLDVMVPETLPLVQADTMRIGQILQNLVGNAIKYSPGGGRIQIRAGVWEPADERWPSQFEHQVSNHRQWAVIEVQDEGLGIPRADLPKVFSRFFRANNTLDGEITGVGLGLSICAELVRAHGGVIWAVSEVGAGSTFAFAVPVA